MTPENRTHTGVGATAWASASQKWNGTIAPLTSSPTVTSTKATITSPSGGRPASVRPIWAMFRAPVRPYSRPMPESDR